MRTVTRIFTCLVSMLLHASGTPNPTIDGIDRSLCLSFNQAAQRGLEVTALRDEFTAAVDVFPGQRPEVAEAWTELQYRLRDQLEVSDLTDLGGSSMFSIFFFEADGRIARVIYRGLDPEQEKVLCGAVRRLAEEYRFPLQSAVRFSQCGTTHFADSQTGGSDPPTSSPMEPSSSQ